MLPTLVLSLALTPGVDVLGGARMNHSGRKLTRLSMSRRKPRPDISISPQSISILCHG